MCFEYVDTPTSAKTQQGLLSALHLELGVLELFYFTWGHPRFAGAIRGRSLRTRRAHHVIGSLCMFLAEHDDAPTAPQDKTVF